MSSTTPAALVTVSSWKSSPAVVIDQVVAESVISPLGVTLVPDHDEYAPPYTSVLIVSGDVGGSSGGLHRTLRKLRGNSLS